VRAAAVVPNPIAVDRWPFQTEKDDYLLWIGRMDPVKGAHRAIEAARLASRPLVLAGPVQTGQADYFHEQIEPQIDDRRVRYIGEVGGIAKQQLFAHAAALLMPVRWDEPFGMVMIEALACGTPVIAFPEGAATEIVIDGHNGMLVADETEMARAVGHVGAIDPSRCRDECPRALRHRTRRRRIRGRVPPRGATIQIVGVAHTTRHSPRRPTVGKRRAEAAGRRRARGKIHAMGGRLKCLTTVLARAAPSAAAGSSATG
jgi:glycosyltransferase involved in cell wall biosynthesis